MNFVSCRRGAQKAVLKPAWIWLTLIPLVVSQPAMAQSIIDAGGAQAAAVGLGAGMAASAGHGKVVNRSYKSLVGVSQAAVVQGRAIEAYMKLGCQFESKKQWANADKSYKYVLQVIARRDGPGSPNGVPALKRLVTVSEALNDVNGAIGYQETVLAFAQRAKIPNVAATLQAQLDLSRLLIQKEDYPNAESVLVESAALCESNPTVQPERRRLTLRTYAKVLRKLHKDSAADKIDALEADSAKPSESAQGESPKTEKEAHDVPSAPGTASHSQEQLSDANRTPAPHNENGTSQSDQSTKANPDQQQKEAR